MSTFTIKKIHTMHRIDNTSSNIHIEYLIKNMDKINSAISNGYVSDKNLSELLARLPVLLETVSDTKKRILSGNNVGLDFILPALDHLRIFLTNDMMGSIALVSKSLNQAITKAHGPKQTELFILAHYLEHPIYKYKESLVKILFEGNILIVPIDMHIIMKKRLRNIIGPELYFKEHDEIFYVSDIDHILNSQGNNYRIVTCMPYESCVFCKEIKTLQNIHIDCARNYHKLNKSIVPKQYETKRFYCKNIFPELTHLFYMNNKKYFPPPKFDKISFMSKFDIEIMETCEINCYYKGIIGKNKKSYTKEKCDYFWKCIDTNTMPEEFKTTCRGYYLIRRTCINEKCCDFTPCQLCRLPRFLHQIDYDK